MTSTTATELKKLDGTRYMAPDGSVYAREKGNYDNYHGFANKHFVGDSVGDSTPVSKDLNDVKVIIFEYDCLFEILTILSCLRRQQKISLCIEICTLSVHYLILLHTILEHYASNSSFYT